MNFHVVHPAADRRHDELLVRRDERRGQPRDPEQRDGRDHAALEHGQAGHVGELRLADDRMISTPTDEHHQHDRGRHVDRDLLALDLECGTKVGEQAEDHDRHDAEQEDQGGVAARLRVGELEPAASPPCSHRVAASSPEAIFAWTSGSSSRSFHIRSDDQRRDDDADQARGDRDRQDLGQIEVVRRDRRSASAWRPSRPRPATRRAPCPTARPSPSTAGTAGCGSCTRRRRSPAAAGR